VLAAVAAGLAQLMGDAGGLWVLLDAAAGLGAASAVAMLLRSAAVNRDLPPLAEFATGVVVAGLCVAVLLVALHGPEGRLGAALLEGAAAMGVVLTLLIVSGATVRYLRARRSGTGAVRAAGDGAGRGVVLGTALASVAATAAVLIDVIVR
jgi:hypothetical protein